RPLGRRGREREAEESELKAEVPPAAGVEVAGVVPPFGRVLLVRAVVAREAERARREGPRETGRIQTADRLDGRELGEGAGCGPGASREQDSSAGERPETKDQRPKAKCRR